MKYKCKIMLSFATVVAIVLCLLSGRGSATVAEHAGGVGAPSLEPTQDAITRFLILGRDRAAGLTDSMLIVTLDEARGTACVLQIPRDTYANYTDKSYKKLNGALRALGEKGIKEALSRALGVRLDFFIVMDLDFLCRAVDIVGGVDLEIPEDMTYCDPAQQLNIKLPHGMAHLNGRQAEEFVRYRSGYANADLGRLDAQKLFLRAFIQKCAGLSSRQLFLFTTAALTEIATDITPTRAFRLASCLSRLDTDEILMATLFGAAAQGTSGASYYVVNREGACSMVNDYLKPRVPLTLAEFDPNGFFDRAEHPDFHRIYSSPKESIQ